MRILIVCHSFNSLTQKLYVSLSEQGVVLSVVFDINEDTLRAAVERFAPDVIVAPFLKRAIPDDIWQRLPCFIVHPGIAGDRGPSALDWAILRGDREWGVTVLQANDVWDGGPIWSEQRFALAQQTKGHIYRHALAAAAETALTQALQRYRSGESPEPQAGYPGLTGQWHGPINDTDRMIVWTMHTTDEVLRRVRSADGDPGVLAELMGQTWRLFDAWPETELRGSPGDIIATQEQAICVACIDGAVWLGHLAPAERRLDDAGRKKLKLPALMLLDVDDQAIPELTSQCYQPVLTTRRDDTAFVYFNFYNGAMSVQQCRQLQKEIERVAALPIKRLVLMGGDDFWCNGLNLNTIEAADSAAEASWQNINAMNDLCETIIRLDHLQVCSVMRGNAGAGGFFLALTADRVLASEAAILNPHYKSMGNLYGSEYWTYLLPKRLSADAIEGLMQQRLPISTQHAKNIGLIDDLYAGQDGDLEHQIIQWLDSHLPDDFVVSKKAQREADERIKPLAEYRREELAQMHLNFFGFDPSYHVARYHFVHKTPKSRTPSFLVKEGK